MVTFHVASEEAMYLCLCRALTEEDVRAAGWAGARSAAALIAALKLDDRRCCGRCRRDIDSFVRFVDRELATDPTTALTSLPAGATNAEERS